MFKYFDKNVNLQHTCTCVYIAFKAAQMIVAHTCRCTSMWDGCIVAHIVHIECVWQ